MDLDICDAKRLGRESGVRERDARCGIWLAIYPLDFHSSSDTSRLSPQKKLCGEVVMSKCHFASPAAVCQLSSFRVSSRFHGGACPKVQVLRNRARRPSASLALHACAQASARSCLGSGCNTFQRRFTTFQISLSHAHIYIYISKLVILCPPPWSTSLLLANTLRYVALGAAHQGPLTRGSCHTCTGIPADGYQVHGMASRQQPAASSKRPPLPVPLDEFSGIARARGGASMHAPAEPPDVDSAQYLGRCFLAAIALS